ncbi:MAG: hypothetical protein QME64_04645, partial [bacterium]|nr:hypothetical protein [bacterium]
DKVLKFAVTKIPREKISLGMPIYGINWYDRSTSRGDALSRPDVVVKDEEAMYFDAVALAKQYHARIQFDEPGQSHWFTYTDASTGIKRTVWFESHFGFRSRWELAKRYRVGGISLWRIGGEDPKLWRYLRADKSLYYQSSDPNFPKGKSGPQFGIDIIFGW